MTAPHQAWPGPDPQDDTAADQYTCDFVRVPAGQMEGLARLGVLAVLHRDGARTRIYCHGDHLGAGLAGALSENATRYSRATVRHDEPVSPRRQVRFSRVPQSELPADMPTVATVAKDRDRVTWVAEDQMSEEMAAQLTELCAEQTRYMSLLPVIAPAADNSHRRR